MSTKVKTLDIFGYWIVLFTLVFNFTFAISEIFIVNRNWIQDDDRSWTTRISVRMWIPVFQTLHGSGHGVRADYKTGRTFAASGHSGLAGWKTEVQSKPWTSPKLSSNYTSYLFFQSKWGHTYYKGLYFLAKTHPSGLGIRLKGSGTGIYDPVSASVFWLWLIPSPV